ncbi:hypothetical protein PAXRUDRAFT_575503 [Paxillus rubicundulus Ve08.2h10]|uniref:Uncharacterized protein n=1 Tax=Paxillus rubicundulus Ve08.2h10 TaxID=930991 RepID=A0A0D0E482_9AGAM|nr:hypothetical protein PAXRUDRAFT_575503 [Paxillus rubicundulus Ve08.2h10]
MTYESLLSVSGRASGGYSGLVMHPFFFQARFRSFSLGPVANHVKIYELDVDLLYSFQHPNVLYRLLRVVIDSFPGTSESTELKNMCNVLEPRALCRKLFVFIAASIIIIHISPLEHSSRPSSIGRKPIQSNLIPPHCEVQHLSAEEQGNTTLNKRVHSWWKTSPVIVAHFWHNSPWRA